MQFFTVFWGVNCLFDLLKYVEAQLFFNVLMDLKINLEDHGAISVGSFSN